MIREKFLCLFISIFFFFFLKKNIFILIFFFFFFFFFFNILVFFFFFFLREFLSLFCSFGEVIHGILLEHTNAKGTTCSSSVAETLPKIYFGPFCEFLSCSFLIFGVFVCACVNFNFFNFWLF
jgi:hypothetical protein